MATSDVSLPDGARMHPYIVAIVRWCVSYLWSTATVLLHRLMTSPITLPAITLPAITRKQSSQKPPKRPAGRDHLDPEPKVECVILHEPPADQYQLDVVFVHGLYGSLGNTWRQGEWRSKYPVGPERVHLRRPTSIPVPCCCPACFENIRRDQNCTRDDHSCITNEQNDVNLKNCDLFDRNNDIRINENAKNDIEHEFNEISDMKCKLNEKSEVLNDFHEISNNYRNIDETFMNNFKRILPNNDVFITEKFYNNTLFDKVEIVDNYETQAQFVSDLFKNCDIDCDEEIGNNIFYYKKNNINHIHCIGETTSEKKTNAFNQISQTVELNCKCRLNAKQYDLIREIHEHLCKCNDDTRNCKANESDCMIRDKHKLNLSYEKDMVAKEVNFCESYCNSITTESKSNVKNNTGNCCQSGDETNYNYKFNTTHIKCTEKSEDKSNFDRKDCNCSTTSNNNEHSCHFKANKQCEVGYKSKDQTKECKINKDDFEVNTKPNNNELSYRCKNTHQREVSFISKDKVIPQNEKDQHEDGYCKTESKKTEVSCICEYNKSEVGYESQADCNIKIKEENQDFCKYNLKPKEVDHIIDCKENNNEVSYICKCNAKQCEVGCGCVCDACYSPCWPKDWIKVDYPGARVISINYTSDPHLWRPLWIKESKRLRLHERAEQMTEQLLALGVGRRPIVWVGHSKGGLFIKQIYCEAFEAHQKKNETNLNKEQMNECDQDNIMNKDRESNNKTQNNIEINISAKIDINYEHKEPSEENKIYISNENQNKENIESIFEDISKGSVNNNSAFKNNEEALDNRNDYDKRLNESEQIYDNVCEVEEKCNFEVINESFNANKDEMNFIELESPNDTDPLPDCSSLYENSAAFMFYSVPHRGSPLADIKTPVTARSVELLEIAKDCSLVLSLQERWLAATTATQPLVRSLVETRRTLMSVLWLRIVSTDSADPGIGALCGVAVDHREICKPTSRRCLLYTELAKLIRVALDRCMNK